jgi:hypothetical protein
LSAVSRQLDVSRSALREWESAGIRGQSAACPRCDDAPLDASAYAGLVGYYLGDGCVSLAHRYESLRISCDASYPGIVEDVGNVMRRVRPGIRVFHVAATGTTVVQAHWRHWTCLFPQHGPGRKHERSIRLEAWQTEIVAQHPDDFLRGLFHSDGARVANWARRPVAGEMKRYAYPRWQFSNRSADIRDLCCWALDLVDVPWRQSSAVHISVSTRVGVARLDELIGPKT